MSCILHIETSTSVCSVAISQDGVCIYDEMDENGPSHAKVLAPFVESVRATLLLLKTIFCALPTRDLWKRAVVSSATFCFNA